MEPCDPAGFFVYLLLYFKQGELKLKKIFIGNLPKNANEDAVRSLFSEYGTVRSIQLVMDIFSGQCRGFGFIEMEGHEAKGTLPDLMEKVTTGKI